MLKYLCQIQYSFLVFERPMANFQIRQAVVDGFCVTTIVQLTINNQYLLGVFHASSLAGSREAELSPQFLPSGSLWSGEWGARIAII